MSSLTVHHLGHSQSDRIVWLCEELSIPYTLKKYDRNPVFSPPEYQALHPIGAAPVIEDTSPLSNTPIKLAESEACAEYIVQVHGSNRLTIPPSSPAYADYLYWYHVANGTLQPAFGRVMTLRAAGVTPENQILVRYQEKIRQIVGLMDQQLGKTGKWLAGEEFSLADVMSVFSVTVMRTSICPALVYLTALSTKLRKIRSNRTISVQHHGLLSGSFISKASCLR